MLNQRIKSLRLEHGYSQAYIAKRLGISRSAYTMYETESASYHYEYLLNCFFAICNLLVGF